MRLGRALRLQPELHSQTPRLLGRMPTLLGQMPTRLRQLPRQPEQMPVLLGQMHYLSWRLPGPPRHVLWLLRPQRSRLQLRGTRPR